MKILFVCSGNACRSPLAEALLKKLRPDFEVDSAGLHVMIPICAHTKEYLARRKAAEFVKKKPQEISEKNLTQYNLIVAMENMHKDAVLASCPECIKKIVVWNIEDPYFLTYEKAEAVYRQIEDKVKEMAES